MRWGALTTVGRIERRRRCASEKPDSRQPDRGLVPELPQSCSSPYLLRLLLRWSALATLWPNTHECACACVRERERGRERRREGGGERENLPRCSLTFFKSSASCPQMPKILELTLCKRYRPRNHCRRCGCGCSTSSSVSPRGTRTLKCTC